MASLLLHLVVEKPIVRAQSVPATIGAVVTLYLAAITLVHLHRSLEQKDWFQDHGEVGDGNHIVSCYRSFFKLGVTKRRDIGLDTIVKRYIRRGPSALTELSLTKQEQIMNNAKLEEYTHKWWKKCPSTKALSNKYKLHPNVRECKVKVRIPFLPTYSVRSILGSRKHDVPRDGEQPLVTQYAHYREGV